ncbi:PREDICTED: pre-mRNA-splicing factor CWC21-like isoform X1 [Nelumbo nucifera]|uniref:RRM domain-containing protein n=2 Tax=Nelumbo nucifera TaxID=4432 RepID=A0A822XKF4_NELNU|nr:PREDICTED: pre-mRNA-splicing factor CWC21-like isoform X1 [Nelumbo nucifera]DAD20492.1 TPA_asm: hypothetical protein HUJ06_021955 [Nelumbo nucifera]
MCIIREESLNRKILIYGGEVLLSIKKKSSLLHDKKLEEKISRSLQCEKNESACEEMEMGNNNHPMERSVCPAKMQNSPDETEQDVFHASRLSTDSRKLELHHSDLYSPQRTSERSVSPLRQMSISPKRSTHMELSLVQKPISPPQNIQDPLYSTRPSRQKCFPPLERSTADGKRISSQGHLSPARGNFASPWRQSSQDSQCRDGCSEKCPSRSSRGHHLPSDDRQPGRSQSQSPNRCRYSSAYRRDDCDRSRSRSSRTGDHQRRPPRMYSPRHRSPPSGYHSRRRSPRRRPWSPPPNRSTGVGRPGNNLFVAGFSFVTTERDLERKFSRFGRVRDVRIVRDKRCGDSRGFGFLSLERDEDADAAIRALDQTEWNGRIVMVEKSKTR